MALFRFEELDIWKEAIKLAGVLFRIANELEKKRLWRFADQLRGVGMSIPNNISESTGSNMVRDQQRSLRVSKKECFEAANILVLLENESLIDHSTKTEVYARLSVLSKRIQAYSDSLNRKMALKTILISSISLVCTILLLLRN